MNLKLLLSLDLGVKEKVVELMLVTRHEVHSKSFVFSCSAPDSRAFIAKNSGWYHSSAMNRPFRYLPEARAGELVAMEITLPRGKGKISFAVDAWNKEIRDPSEILSSALFIRDKDSVHNTFDLHVFEKSVK